MDFTCQIQKPAISSLVSAKGPSITRGGLLVNCTRLPLEEGCRPSPASMMPALTSSSLKLPIAAKSSVEGMTPASVSLVAFTNTNTFITSSSRGLGCYDHPAHAELVGEHAEAGGEEGLDQRLLDLAAIGEAVEDPLRLGIVLRLNSERDAGKMGLARAVAVRRHDQRLADPELRMHDLVARMGRRPAHVPAAFFGRGFHGRRILEAHPHIHLGADRLGVEIERLFGTALERQIRLNTHGLFLFLVDQRGFRFLLPQRTCRGISRSLRLG